MKHLAEEVAATARAVSDWRSKIASLEGQARELNGVIAKSSAAREGRALSSLLGDPAAKADIARARSQQHEAEQELADIVRYALPAAMEALAVAEREAQGARTALTQYRTDILRRQRIAVAGDLDKAIAEFERVYRKYELLGREIANMPDAVAMTSSFGMLNHEGVVGLRRVAAALPKFVALFFPGAMHDELKKEPLALTEARFWNLAPEQSAKAA